MDNVTTISILDRALKGRNRRDRDGKNRRPVTDGLIEYAKDLRDENTALNAKIIELKKEIYDFSPSLDESESTAA